MKITPNPVGDNTINFEVYNDAVLLTTLTNISYKGNARAIKIRAELIDDKLYIWTDDFTGPPLKIITGITQLNPGYVGVFAAGSQQSISSYKTHFDSAFDLLVRDPVPQELGVLTAITPAATPVGNTITWPVIAGPIAAGSSTIYTFKATVNTCTNFITNIAHASIYGNPDIASQYVVNCKNTSCTPPEITSVASGSTCSGSPQNYSITSNSATASITWSRAAVAGISNAAVTDQNSSSIKEVLTNTGTSPVVVTYVLTASEDDCSSEPFNYEVTVNPGLTVTSAATGSICSGAAQNYDITASSTTATFTWSRAAVTGISNAAVTGQTADPIVETLTNTGTGPLVVRYVITPAAPGCTGTAFNYDVTVNTSLEVTSPATGGICSGAAQNYLIESSIPGATYTWSRAAVAGISNTELADQTSNPITEALTNTGSDPVVVSYLITPKTAGCTGTPFKYDVTVTNALKITSPATGTACSGTAQNYDITSNISGAVFTWSRAVVPGISNGVAEGQNADPIVENLINTISDPVVVRYVISAAAPGCATAENLNYDVTINPSPVVTSDAAGSICSGAGQNYDIKSSISGATFSWSRAAVTGINNAALTAQTTDPITESLINTGTSPAIVRYVITPLIGTCKGADFNYDLTVNPAPLINSAATGAVCTGTAQNYDIESNNVSSTFTWSRAAVAGISNAAAADQTADPILETLINTGSTPIVVRYVITPSGAGCPGIPFDYAVTVNPVPQMTSAGEGTICSGVAQNFDLTSNSSTATFTWGRALVAGISNAETIGQTADPITEILTNTGSDEVVVRYVIVPTIGTCKGDAVNYDVTVSPAARIITQPSSTTICGGDPLNLSVEATGGNVTYQWKLNGNSLGGATNSSYNLTAATTDNSGKYTVEVSSKCNVVASEDAIVAVRISPSDALSVLGGKACQGSSALVTILNSQKGVDYEPYSGGVPVGILTAGTGSDLVLTINTGSLTLGSNNISIHANGCDNKVLTNSADVTVTALPKAVAGDDVQVDDYTLVPLDGKGSSLGAFTYLWSSPDPAALITTPAVITTTVLPKVNSTDFVLTVTDAANTACKSSDVVTVKVALQPLFVPDAFSPNGDGIHDLFEIPQIKNYPQSLLYVYNQWGELIYKSAPGYTVLWDGTRNGTPVPVSGYYYILELNDGTQTTLSGSITIIK